MIHLAEDSVNSVCFHVGLFALMPGFGCHYDGEASESDLNLLSLSAPGPPHKQSTPAPSGTSDKSSTKVSEVGDDVLGDFVVGERVWVNGVKPGCIHYLGETQFAPGQWAGVVLNEPVGKNDGSVGGVRYFECQPMQGIFTRPSKLTRQPMADASDAHSTESLTAQNLTLHGGATPSAQRVGVPLREGMLNSSVKTGNESGSNMSDSGSVKKGGDKDLRVGDRVLVSPDRRLHSCGLRLLGTAMAQRWLCLVLISKKALRHEQFVLQLAK